MARKRPTLRRQRGTCRRHANRVRPDRELRPRRNASRRRLLSASLRRERPGIGRLHANSRCLPRGRLPRAHIRHDARRPARRLRGDRRPRRLHDRLQQNRTFRALGPAPFAAKPCPLRRRFQQDARARSLHRDGAVRATGNRGHSQKPRCFRAHQGARCLPLGQRRGRQANDRFGTRGLRRHDEGVDDQSRPAGGLRRLLRRRTSNRRARTQRRPRFGG